MQLGNVFAHENKYVIPLKFDAQKEELKTLFQYVFAHENKEDAILPKFDALGWKCTFGRCFHEF